MKSIQLKKSKETIAEREVEFDSRDLIKMVLNHPPEKGFDVSEMKNRMKVLNVVESANGNEILELEDADFAVLGACVKAMRWGILSKTVLEFATQFENASSSS